MCGLDYGHPYADRARTRIYVRGMASREDRIEGATRPRLRDGAGP